MANRRIDPGGCLYLTDEEEAIVLERSGGVCIRCAGGAGHPPAPDLGKVLLRLEPRITYGSDELSNIGLFCDDCGIRQQNAELAAISKWIRSIRNRKRSYCTICNDHAFIVQSHHEPEVAYLAEVVMRFEIYDVPLPIQTVWLCPNHHAYLHLHKSRRTSDLLREAIRNQHAEHQRRVWDWLVSLPAKLSDAIERQQEVRPSQTLYAAWMAKASGRACDIPKPLSIFRQAKKGAVAA